MANFVKNDLTALGGYGSVYVSNIRPNIISSGETLIAIRKGSKDFHFMKFHPDGGFWTHKPGGTAILKYNHQSDDKVWGSEAIIDSSGAAQAGSVTYNSEIYYIIYNRKGLIIQGNTVTDFILQAGFNGQLTIPDGVNAIGPSAFANQTQMTQISIPDSVTSIGSNAFENCTSLTNITFPNALTSIGDFTFSGCTSLSNIVLPIGLESIGINSFSSCTSLTNLILPNTLTSIGAVAFYNCIGLKAILIPDSVTSIGNIAFANCTNLESVTFQKETANITQLGTSVFAYCDKLNEIIVPTNRIAEYKNQVNWSRYSHLIVSSTEFEDYNLNCFSGFNITTSLEAGYNKLYKLEVECPKSYKIISNSSSAIEMSLYNSNINLMSTSNEIITSYLSPGIYYLDLSFIDDSSCGDINTSFGLLWVHNGWDVSYNIDNDVLTHLHQIEPNLYKNKIQYFNNQGAGFFEFNLSGINIDGSTPYYKEGAITIYGDSSRTNILSKFAGYSTEAKTSENLNRMIVYLPSNGYFYIDINMNSNNLESLSFRISPLVSQEVSIFNLAENTDESINIFNETTYGEYFQRLKINQAGRFTVHASYSGFQNNILFVLAKLNYDITTNKYTLDAKITDILSAKDYPDPKTLTLVEGTYYIGYFNKNDDLSLNVSINRLVTLSGSQVLLSDPEAGALCGSQINIIEMNESIKSYRETFITKDFTRILYPNYNYIYQTSSSRLDYNWYSSNENIATVTPYGTVLGKNVGTVKIMAVLKTDPSKVFVKEFTIIADIGTDAITVYSTLNVKLSETDNGTFKLNLEKVNCPYPWFQDYAWSVFIPEQYNDLIVDIDVWGNTTINKIGSFELTGTYLKNSRVTVKINVIIEP